MAECECAAEAQTLERRTLVVLLVINAAMFVIEVVVGWLAESTGLMADGLDMLADASVYGIALTAVGRSVSRQTFAATASGVLQISLGALLIFEVARRYIYGSEPVSALMIGIGAVALAANLYCLVLIAKHKHGGVHMRASWIFSRNDVIANAGVITSGVLVMLLGSNIPDLLIGALISAIVLHGGFSILADARKTRNIKGC